MIFAIDVGFDRSTAVRVGDDGAATLGPWTDDNESFLSLLPGLRGSLLLIEEPANVPAALWAGRFQALGRGWLVSTQLVVPEYERIMGRHPLLPDEDATGWRALAIAAAWFSAYGDGRADAHPLITPLPHPAAPRVRLLGPDAGNAKEPLYGADPG